MTDDLKVRDMGKQSYELVKKIGISEEKYIEELLIFYQKTL